VRSAGKLISMLELGRTLNRLLIGGTAALLFVGVNVP
jgi:hypothetical protein